MTEGQKSLAAGAAAIVEFGTAITVLALNENPKKPEYSDSNISVSVQEAMIAEGYKQLPVEHAKESADKADRTINSIAVSLEIPKDVACNIQSLRDVSTRLDKACVTLSRNNATIAEYNTRVDAVKTSAPYVDYMEHRDEGVYAHPLVGIGLALGLLASSVYAGYKSLSYAEIGVFNSREKYLKIVEKTENPNPLTPQHA